MGVVSVWISTLISINVFTPDVFRLNINRQINKKHFNQLGIQLFIRIKINLINNISWQKHIAVVEQTYTLWLKNGFPEYYFDIYSANTNSPCDLHSKNCIKRYIEALGPFTAHSRKNNSWHSNWVPWEWTICFKMVTFQ